MIVPHTGHFFIIGKGLQESDGSGVRAQKTCGRTFALTSYSTFTHFALRASFFTASYLYHSEHFNTETNNSQVEVSNFLTLANLLSNYTYATTCKSRSYTTTSNYRTHKCPFLFAYLCIALSTIIGYAQTNNALKLPSEQLNHIYNLPEPLSTIPTKLIHELSNYTSKLNSLIKSKQVSLKDLKKVNLNELMGNPSTLKGSFLRIKGYPVRVKRVTYKLSPPSSENFYSVFLLDAQYHLPIQCFTTKIPTRFKKLSLYWIVGIFIANRVENDKTFPVIVGFLVPISTNERYYKFITSVVILAVIYFIIRFYILKTTKRYKRETKSKRP